MENAVEKAEALRLEGYNCAQSVFGAFAEDCGVDFEDAMRIASSFGGGIAQLRGVCGAFTGMCMAMGARYGYGKPRDKAEKEDFNAKLQEMEREFREGWGTTNCGELLQNAKDTGSGSPCNALIRHGAEITQRLFQKLDG